MKMEKHRILALCALFMLLFNSCSTNSNISLNDDISNASAEVNYDSVNLPNLTDVEYNIYFDSVSAEDTLMLESIDNSVAKAQRTDGRFKISSMRDIKKTDELIETLNVDNREYSLQYIKSFETAISASKRHSDYSQFDKYSLNGDPDNGVVTINRATGAIETFYDFNVPVPSSGDITKEEACKKAEKILAELFGEDVLNQYKYVDKYIYEVSGYTVAFKRYIYEMPTNDMIIISLNKAGDVYSINAKTKDICATAESDLQKIQIESAVSILKTSFPEGYSFNNNGEFNLTVDIYGNYYLEASVAYVDKNSQAYNYHVYINLQ